MEPESESGRNIQTPSPSNLGGTSTAIVCVGTIDEQEEMDIFLKVMKTIKLKVKSSDTIDDVKTKFRDVEGVAPNLQELFFDGYHLKNGQKLADYGIYKGSTIHMIVPSNSGTQIQIKASQIGKTFTLDMRSSETIYNVKAQIQDMEQIPLNRQILIYNGKQLEDNQTLAAYDIKYGSTLNVVFCSGDGMRLFVNIPNGDTIKLDVKIWYTIENIKAMIEGMVAIPRTQQQLIYSGNQLKDHHCLVNYDIREECTLDMLLSPKQILVKSHEGNTITLEVESSSTINDVMAKIEEKLGIPSHRQSLVFAGRHLVQDKTLADYKVLHGSTLNLTIRAHLVLDAILVHLPSGEAIAIDSQPSDAISDVKTKIQNSTQMLVSMQTLTYKGKILEDHYTLMDYGIVAGSKLKLKLKLLD